jgi:hypothetical protein
VQEEDDAVDAEAAALLEPSQHVVRRAAVAVRLEAPAGPAKRRRPSARAAPTSSRRATSASTASSVVRSVAGSRPMRAHSA